MTEPNKGGAPRGNRNNLRHSLRSAKTLARERNTYLRRKFRRMLITSHPGLDSLELQLGIDIQVGISARRSYYAGLPPNGPQGRQAARTLTELAASWERWCTRNEHAKRSANPYDDILAALNREDPR